MNQPPEPKGLGRIFADVIELCELQWQLISVDSQHAKRQLIKGSVLAGLAAIFVAGACLCFALAAGWLLEDLTTLPTSACFGIVGLTGVLIAAILGWIAIRRFGAASDALTEAKSEFSENLKWLKATIISPESSARNRFRAHDFHTQTQAPQSDRR
ncbi:phage holin family protein [Stieleria sp. TO1_6]|uniref:phage holin family protein n=1 Tax=Stieleria tagensis TaxID=2956795 RepID=UPI00209AB277|nr:phage holin family protein [Stieleria tagensis]MCO8124315.1 phage holin family protein [Stieleria tagensis]